MQHHADRSKAARTRTRRAGAVAIAPGCVSTIPAGRYLPPHERTTVPTGETALVRCFACKKKSHHGSKSAVHPKGGQPWIAIGSTHSAITCRQQESPAAHQRLAGTWSRRNRWFCTSDRGRRCRPQAHADAKTTKLSRPANLGWQSCVCPPGTTRCGPDCCPIGSSSCCDNACCYGTCVAEEICCPTGTIYCSGDCLQGECCTNDQCFEGQTCNPEANTCESACLPGQCGDGCPACLEGYTCNPQTNTCESTCRPGQCSDGCPECEDGYACIRGECFVLCVGEDWDCPGVHWLRLPRKYPVLR